jgi:flagellar hook-basal body complex protein FliE
MQIGHIQTATVPQSLPVKPSQGLAEQPFANVLQGAVEQVNSLQNEADAAARAFAVGQASSIHDTMIALEKADVSLRLVTRVRNQAVEAYQEIMRMPI